MTEELIKEVKHIQKCLIDRDMAGDEWEEKMEIVRKLAVLHVRQRRGRLLAAGNAYKQAGYLFPVQLRDAQGAGAHEEDFFCHGKL